MRLGEFVTDRLKGVFFARDQHQFGAFCGHLTRAFGAEPEAAAGDNGDLVFELEINRHDGPAFAISYAYLMERQGARVNACLS